MTIVVLGCNMLVFVVFGTFGVALVISLVLEVCARYTSSKSNTNPQFLAFQRGYIVIYYLVVLGDWLNAPYLYKLYTNYGFLEEQIAIIYVCGYAASLVIGISSSAIATKYGHRRVFIFAAIMYAVASLMKLSADYSTLVIGRIISGSATSLLFTAQELWYVNMHLNHHDFPPEWLTYTFEKSAKGNGALSILAGVIAYMMTEVYGWGPVAPSVLSSAFFCLACGLVWAKWEDVKQKTPPLLPSNQSNVSKSREKKFMKECLTGLRTIFESRELLSVGLMQALYESVLCLFVFLWTPVLDHHDPPLGIVFSSFMTGSLAAGALYSVMRSVLKRLSPATLLLGLFMAATGTVLFCVVSTEPTREFPVVSFVAFFTFETISGLYFPVMRDVKHLVGLDSADFAITAWFRVPLNLFACLGLLFLHTSSNIAGTKHLFACCVALIGLASLISAKFRLAFNHKYNSSDLDDF